MNKVVIGLVVAVVVIVGGIGYLVTVNNSANNNKLAGSTNTTTSSTSPLTPVNACDVLTDNVVRDIVGSDVKKVSQPTKPPLGTVDNTITTCYYLSTPTTTDPSVSPKMNGVTLLVYAAKTTAGAESNKSQFTTKSSDIQPVSGVGDAAFYNNTFRQLNILKGNNWYVITNFKDTILNASLDSDLALAKKLSLK